MVVANPDLNAFGTERMQPLLVIEVAEPSLPRDLRVKPSIYAEASVPEYWVVNLVAGLLEVFRNPEEGQYRDHFSLPANTRVSPVAWPDLNLDVADMFPDDPPS